MRLWEMRERQLKIAAHRERCHSLPPPSRAEAERLIAEFIAARGGVTQCPVAYAVAVSSRAVPAIKEPFPGW
jgi:hypothetical protein